MVMPSGEFKLHVSAFPAHADPFILPRTNQFEIGAGVVIPTGILGRERGAGPLLRAGMQRRAPKSRIRLRLDGEVFRIAAAAVPTSPSSPQGALTSVGMVLNAIAAPRGVRVAPYGLAKIGVQYLRKRRMYIPALLRACVLVPEFEPGLDELTSLPRSRRRRQFLRRSEVSNHPELVRIGR